MIYDLERELRFQSYFFSKPLDTSYTLCKIHSHRLPFSSTYYFHVIVENSAADARKCSQLLNDGSESGKEMPLLFWKNTPVGSTKMKTRSLSSIGTLAMCHCLYAPFLPQVQCMDLYNALVQTLSLASVKVMTMEFGRLLSVIKNLVRTQCFNCTRPSIRNPLTINPNQAGRPDYESGEYASIMSRVVQWSQLYLNHSADSVLWPDSSCVGKEKEDYFMLLTW
jgi:hypothetical protein